MITVPQPCVICANAMPGFGGPTTTTAAGQSLRLCWPCLKALFLDEVEIRWWVGKRQAIEKEMQP